MPKNESQYQPSSILFRHKDFTQHISSVLGAIDFHQNYDNSFNRAKLIMKFLPELIIAIESDVCKVPKDFKETKLPELKKHAYKLDKIWNGDCFKTSLDGVHKFHYEYPEEAYDEIVKMPRLKNMVPVNELKDDTLWIQVREPLPIKYAFNRTNWAILVQEGGFSIQTNEGSVAKISEEDMDSTDKFTYVYSRDVYHNIVDDETLFFDRHWFPISVICQDILDKAEFELLLDDSVDPEEDFKTNYDTDDDE